jgi:hypothetical protein
MRTGEDRKASYQLPSGASGKVCNQRYEKQHEEDHEQYLRDPGGGYRDPGETKHTGDQRNNEKN